MRSVHCGQYRCTAAMHLCNLVQFFHIAVYGWLKFVQLWKNVTNVPRFQHSCPDLPRCSPVPWPRSLSGLAIVATHPGYPNWPMAGVGPSGQAYGPTCKKSNQSQIRPTNGVVAKGDQMLQQKTLLNGTKDEHMRLVPNMRFIDGNFSWFDT